MSRMNPFKVFYYPNSECSPLVLAKGILVFDEITFFDHPSLTFPKFGTIGHDSFMRSAIPTLEKEGYPMIVVKPGDGPVEGELQKIIDADLANEEFRKTFLQLLRNDPSFLIRRVPEGNYGKQGDAKTYRRAILNVDEVNIPKTVEEIRNYKPSEGIPPEINIALGMVSDSFNLNFASFVAMQQNLELFGDSRGMDMLLKAKYQSPGGKQGKNSGAAHKMAFTLLERLVPTKAFDGKSIVDIVRFRNKMSNQRDKFKDRIMGLTLELANLKDQEQEQKFEKLLYKEVIPEIKNYENLIEDNWDNFFKESIKSIFSDSDHTYQLVIAALAISYWTALMVGVAKIGKDIVPKLADFLVAKRALERRNPYAYLMKFN